MSNVPSDRWSVNGEATPETEARAPERGFGCLPCPFCGEQDAIIDLDLSSCREFRCRANDCEFGTTDVESVIERWQTVLAWLKTAPVNES